MMNHQAINGQSVNLARAIDYLPADTADADASLISGKWRPVASAEPYRPMPLSVFPSVVREMIEATARVKDIDLALVAIPVLGVLSAAIGNARRLLLRDDWRVPAVLWPVVVAESGDGKSPGMDAAMRPLLQEQAQLAAEHKAATAEYAAALRIWRVAPRDQRGDEPERPPRMADVYISNATVEAVAVVLSENGRGVLCAVDEFASLVKGWNAYKSGGNDLEAWLSMYDARAVKINRKTGDHQQLFVDHAFVSLTGTIQPGTLQIAVLPAAY